MFQKYKYHLIVLLAGVLWSGLSVFTQILTDLQVNSFNQVLWRVVFGCLFSFLMAKFVFKQKMNIPREKLWLFFVNSLFLLFGFTTFSIGIFLGSPIAKAVALNYSYPLAVIILSYLVFKDVPSKKNILAMFISLAAVAFLLEVWTIKDFASLNLGDVFEWLNSIFFGGIIVWGTKIRKELKPNPFVTLFYSLLMFIPLLFILGFILSQFGLKTMAPIVMTNFNIYGWLSLFGLGVFCSSLPIALLYFGATKLKSFTSSVLLLSEPVMVIILGALLFGQGLSLWGFLGMALVFVAVLLT